ncbi:MAG: hypothetical protein RhofKO_31970 [Rhodothermales bacterium]
MPYLLSILIALLLALPAPAQPLPDTLSAQRHLLALEVERATLSQTALGWRRYLPVVQFTLNARSQNRVFLPLTTTGSALDPTFRQWPTDTWALTASWRVDALFDPLPRRRAALATQQAQARLALHDQQAQLVARRTAERQAKDATQAERTRAHLGALLDLVEAQRRIRADLLVLLEMKYEQGEASFEAVAAERLAVLTLDRQRLTLLHQRHLQSTDHRQHMAESH